MSETVDDDLRVGPAKPGTLAEAFELWQGELCRFVRRTAATYGVADSHVGAEDLVQQVFEAALKTSWDGILYPKAWLYAVARRLVITAAGRHSRSTRSADVRTTGAITWSSLTRLSSTEVQFAANQATELFNHLPTRQKQVAVLRFQLDWSFSEIAEALEMSEATARVQCRNARTAVSGDVISTGNSIGSIVPGPESFSESRRIRRLVEPVLIGVLFLAGIAGLGLAVDALAISPAWRGASLAGCGLITLSGIFVGGLRVWLRYQGFRTVDRETTLRRREFLRVFEAIHRAERQSAALIEPNTASATCAHRAEESAQNDGFGPCQPLQCSTANTNQGLCDKDIPLTQSP